MIRVMRIPHINIKKKRLTKVWSQNSFILVHVVAMYNALQAVLGFLCCYVLRHFPDIHTRINAFAAYNGMVR